jgi:hypothetical protein
MANMTQDLKTIRFAIEAIREQAWTHDSRNKKLSVLRDHIQELQLTYNAKDYSLFSWDADTLTDGLKALDHYLRDTAYGEIHTQVLRRLWVAVDIIGYMLNKIERTSPRQTREKRKSDKSNDVWRKAIDEIDDDAPGNEADADPSA